MYLMDFESNEDFLININSMEKTLNLITDKEK